MKKTIIAAVAALAIAPFTASIPVAHAGDFPACSSLPDQARWQCNAACVQLQVPMQPMPCAGNTGSRNGPDNCAVLLQPPNTSVGAFKGCETARQATGG